MPTENTTAMILRHENGPGERLGIDDMVAGLAIRVVMVDARHRDECDRGS